MKNTTTSLKNKLVFAVFALCAGTASASVIDLATGFSNAGPFADANTYKSVVESAVGVATPGYGHTSLSIFDGVNNQSLFGSNGDIAFDYTINFGVTAANAGQWELRAGVDFGRGGAVFLDGVALGFKSNDMWWAGSYSDPSQYFDFTSTLAAGNHTLSIYGLEGCCDGTQQGQYKAAGSDGFVTFSNADGLDHVVPEPATVALLGLGLFGFGVARRRKQ